MAPAAAVWTTRTLAVTACQSGVGRSTESITSTSSVPREGSSFRPSCSCSAVNTLIASGSVETDHFKSTSNRPDKTVRSTTERSTLSAIESISAERSSSRELYVLDAPLRSARRCKPARPYRHVPEQPRIRRTRPFDGRRPGPSLI